MKETDIYHFLLKNHENIPVSQTSQIVNFTQQEKKCIIV